MNSTGDLGATGNTNTNTNYKYTVLVDENDFEDDYEDINSTVAFVLCIIAFVISILLCCYFCQPLWVDKPSDNFRSKPQAECVPWGQWSKRRQVVSPLLVLFFINTVVYLCYANRLRDRAPMDYHGLMRLSNISIYDYVLDQGKKYTWKTYSEAEVTLDWGYAWACPAELDVQQPDSVSKQCRSKLLLCDGKACDSDHCSKDEIDSARARVDKCLRDYAGAIELVGALNSTSYDPSVGPSQDKGWPSLVAYGDCQSCHVQLQSPSPDELYNLRIAGFVLSGLTFIAFVGTLWVHVELGKQEAMQQKAADEGEEAGVTSPDSQGAEEDKAASSSS